MSRDKNDTKNFTRGGQIFLHNLRMFFQIINKVSIFAGAVFLGITLAISWVSTTSYDRYILTKYLQAETMSFLSPRGTFEFLQPNNVQVKVTYKDFVTNDWVQSQLKEFARKLLIALIAALLSGVFAFTGIWQYLKRKGESHTKNELIKGDKILPAKETRKIIVKQKQDADLKIANLPLIKYTETAHIFFHGTTGVGKSTAIKELLDQIRKRGDRAIIYDKSCNLLEELYSAKTDVILNPLDIRGCEWDLWEECRDSADFDSLAASQIPMPVSSQDPFWVNAARTIFSVAAFEMRNDKDRSVLKLLRTILTADLDKIQLYLKGTEAETLVSEKAEKTAVSIKSVLATYLKSLKYVKEGENSFSIREWIQDDNAHNWLFITSRGDRHETIKPLISTWLDIAVNSLISLTPCDNRRIWFFLDELPSLQQLPSLHPVLAEGRKFGGCIVIGIQTYSDLEKLYGHQGAKSISSLLNTRIMFRIPDPEVAKWSANNLGEAIMDEVKEGVSYGAHSIRDGVSINHNETKKPLVSYSEIMSLSNLTAFVRLPGNFPISLVEFTYKKRKKYNEGFVLRNFDENGMKEIDALLEKAKADAEKNSKKQKLAPKKKEKSVPDKVDIDMAFFED